MLNTQPPTDPQVEERCVMRRDLTSDFIALLCSVFRTYFICSLVYVSSIISDTRIMNCSVLEEDFLRRSYRIRIFSVVQFYLMQLYMYRHIIISIQGILWIACDLYFLPLTNIGCSPYSTYN